MKKENFPKGVPRFPRLFSEEVEAKLDALAVEGWTCHERGRKANVDFGRVLRKFKKIVGHGNWERYFALKFPNSVSVWTARRYMKWAKREDAKLKSGKMPDFNTATHGIAQKVRDATAKARAAAGPKKFHIALSVPPERQDAVRKLQRSLEWLKAEQEILSILEKYTQQQSEVPSENLAAD